MHSFRSVVPMRVAKIGYMVVSTMICMLGILLIAIPELSASMLGIICGILLIAFGIIRIVGYCSKDLYRLAFQYDLVFGILMIAIGVMMLVNPRNRIAVICVALGISFFMDSIFKVQIALDSRKFGIREWGLILGFAVVAGIFSLILIFRPGENSNALLILCGIALLAEGILNFVTVVMAVKIIRHQRPDMNEEKYCEESEGEMT